VPLYDLYFLSLRRAGDQLARGFINEAALPVADALARSPAQLMLAGKGCIAPFDLPRESVDLVVKQGLFEADLAFVMRFEQEVIERLEWLYAAQLRRHLAETITRITDAWAALG
jgi:predicted NBD/HSP70 family sugar kinase